MNQQQIYIICLNPHCQTPQQRCLDGHSLRNHPSSCAQYFYPVDSIINEEWEKLQDYPNDPLGKAASKKVRKGSQCFLQIMLSQFRLKVERIISHLQKSLHEIFPMSAFEKQYDLVYDLSKISKSLKNNGQPQYITQLINCNLSAAHYQQLLQSNSKLDGIVQSLNSISNAMNISLMQVVNKMSENESLKKVLTAENKKIECGVLKSKYIGSSKINYSNGVINFPKMDNIVSFLPWLYSQQSFSIGLHRLQIHALKFPLISNCGFAILEEHDIDTYPYHCFKSLYCKKGKKFELTEGDEIDTLIGSSSTITLQIDLGNNPYAKIYDSEQRCNYHCLLKPDRNYRLALYGCGWSCQITQLF